MASIAEIQALVEQIKNDLPLLINRSQITPKQVVIVNGLSDMSERLGLVQAGEFRSGNGLEPGLGFSGVRMGYPAFVYAGDTWNFVGVNNDVLQVGISADDGKLYAGGGDVVIDENGVYIANNQQGAFGFVDTNGNLDNLVIYSDGNDTIGILNRLPGKAIRQTITLTDSSTPYLDWRENPSVPNATFLDIKRGTAGGRVAFGIDHFIDFNSETGSESNRVYFNERNKDIDFSIETVNQSTAFYMDAALDKATSFLWDGWGKRNETWTRTGNHQFTVSGNVTLIYRKGTKVRYTDGAGFEYGVIASSSYSAGSNTTTVNLIPNTNYTMTANPANTSLSYMDNPEGWVDTFNYTVSATSSSGSFTTISASGTWKVFGSSIKIDISIVITNIGTASGFLFFSLPVTTTGTSIGVGRENAVTGYELQLVVGSAATVGFIQTYHPNQVIVNGYTLLGSITVPF